MDAYAALQLDHKILEKSRENMESEIDILKNQVLTLKNEKSRLKIEKLLDVPSKGKDHVDDTQVNLENMIRCFHCGDNGHFKDICKARVKSVQKNKHYVEKRKEEPKRTLFLIKKRTLARTNKKASFFSHKGTKLV
ncbi:hypothetical protein HAX54_041801 [Datura stramonium]|uniref:CCHC-type domain-containing protein n=1 Tax=Datura stramonium TaxID=4076 RepID=A0ABS8W2A7_DATST|nr:hypothetical protein [Datura stramonium]